MPKICLAMLVKDEAEHVGRCIESVLPLTHSWIIHDTGSTDDTVREIYKHLLPSRGSVRNREWKGFAANRTQLLNEARELHPAADYVLFLDADMEIVQSGPLPDLTADVYNLTVHTAGTEYPLPLLTSTRREFRYEGVAHPLLVCDDEIVTADLPNLHVIDHRPGVHRPGKIEGDRDRLTAHLDGHPDDARSWFYLANSHRDLGDPQAAIEAYLKRASMDGPNEEEIYHSLLMAGLLLCKNVSVGQGMPLLMEAWMARPFRAEALRILAEVANDMADRMPVPTGEQGYVMPSAYGPRTPESVPVGVKPEDVCAIIVTRGDVDLQPILETLPYGETLVVYPDGTGRGDGKWFPRSEDLKVYGRYDAIQHTDKPVIYFADDDIIFRNHTALLAAYEPGKLISNMDPQWVADCGYHDLALVGLGSLIDRDLPRVALDRYQAGYPDDDRFLLDADFAHGVLTPFKRVDLGAEILECASAENRLWRQEGQLAGKQRTINRARALRDQAIKDDMAEKVGAYPFAAA